MNVIDEHFNLLNDELGRYQKEAHYKDADPLNAENLPAVLDDLGIGCAQREIDGLLKLLSSRGIDTVGVLQSATDKRIEIIRNVYVGAEGRVPNHYEIVAGLAAAHSIENPTAISTAVRAQIELLKAWESLRSTGDISLLR